MINPDSGRGAFGNVKTSRCMQAEGSAGIKVDFCVTNVVACFSRELHDRDDPFLAFRSVRALKVIGNTTSG